MYQKISKPYHDKFYLAKVSYNGKTRLLAGRKFSTATQAEIFSDACQKRVNALKK